MSDSKYDEIKSYDDTTRKKRPILDLNVESDSDSDLPTIFPAKKDSLQTRKAASLSKATTQTSSKLRSNRRTTNKDEGSDSSNVRSSKDKKDKTKLSRKVKPKPNIENIFGTTELLDQTSDFAGGFTPYKALAKKRLVRAKKQEVSVNKPQRSSKPDKGQPEEKALKPQNRVLSTRSQITEEKNQQIQENSILTNLASSEVNQIQDLPNVDGEKKIKLSDECERNSASDEGLDKKTCSICGEQIQPGDADHLSKCLQGRFKYKSSSHATNRQNTENKQPEVKNTTVGPEEFVFCQLCQEDITRLSASGRTDHVNACADGAPAVATAEVTKHTSCHICNRDLAELNSRRRLQHVNFCADKAEKQRKDQEIAVKNAREKVLDCPLCGKPLQTLTSRRSHLKQCARVLGVAPGLLNERIKQQQEEYDLQLAAGVLPPPTKVTRPRKPRRRAPPDNSNGRSAAGSHIDSDTALAIALSTSLAEQQRLEAGIAGAPTDIPDVGPVGTNAFQVLMTPKAAKPSKRGRKNKAPDHVPQLLLQSREDLQRHLASRIELLFAQQSNTEAICSTPPMRNVPGSKRVRGILTEGTYQIAEESPLWTLTTLVLKQSGKDSVADKENVNDVFYVQQLMPPVTVCTTQPLVQPGPTASHTSTPSQPNLQSDSGSNSVLSPNETLVATTQTAVYLAELAAEGGNSTLNWTAHGTTLLERSLLDVDSRDQSRCPSAASPETCAPSAHDTSGFVASNARTDGSEPDRDETSCLIEQLRGMVNNPVMSDFQIKVKDGSLYGHKFMIAARCPHLLKDLKNASVIGLTEHDSTTVKTVLTYIYTGAIHNTSAQVAKVAAQWNMTGLLRLLNRPPAEIQRETGVAETSQSNLEEILKNIWGSDYEESDSEGESSKVLEPNEEDMEDACKFVLSQRRMSQRREPSEGADSESEDEQEDEPDSSFNHLNRTAADVLNELAKLDEDSLDSSGDELVPDSTHSDSGSSESPGDKVRTDDTGVPQPQRVYESDNSLKPPNVDSDSDEMQPATYSKVPEQLEEITLLDSDDTDNAVFARSSISVDRQDMPPGLSQRHTWGAAKGTVEMPLPSKSAQVNSLSVTDNKVPPDEVNVLDLTCAPDDVDSDNALGRTKESSNCDISKILLETAAATAESPKVSVWNRSEMSTPDLFAGSPQTPRSVDKESRDCLSQGPTRTLQSDTSDLDLFEVGSSCSDEDSTAKMALSPVFRRTILNEPNTTFTDDDMEPDRIENTKNTNDQSQFDRSSSVNKRKRSPSVSSEEEASLSQRNKKSRLGSLSAQAAGSRSPVHFVESACLGAAEAGDNGSSPRGPRDDYESPSDKYGGGPRDDYESPSDKYGGGPRDDYESPRDKYGGSPKDDYGSPSDKYGESPKDDYGSPRDKYGGSPKDHYGSPRDKYGRSPKDDYGSPSDKSRGGPSDSPVGSPLIGMSGNTGRKAEEHTISSDSELDMAPLHTDDYAGSPHTAAIDLTLEEEDCDNNVDNGRNDQDGKSATDHNISLTPSSPHDIPEEEHVADVWSDFDDMGYTEDFLIPTTQGSQKSAGGQGESPQHVSDVSDGAAVPEADLEYDPPTDMESDISMLEEGPSTSHSAPKHNYVTPKPPRARRKPAAPPSPFTPMADYENMVTPEVKKACLQIGVRAMPKKRMVKLLKSIYESTHQYETDSELEQSFETMPPSRTGREARATIATSGLPPPGMTSAAAATRHADPLRHQQRTSESDSDSEDTDKLSTQAMPTYSNNAEDAYDLPEESFIGTQCEPSSPPDKRSKDKPSTTEAKRERIRSNILGDDDLYLKILHYEPLEFEAYRQKLKELGATMGSNILMDFLDEQNIQFTMRKSKEVKDKLREEKTSRRGGGRGSGRGRGRRPPTANL